MENNNVNEINVSKEALALAVPALQEMMNDKPKDSIAKIEEDLKAMQEAEREVLSKDMDTPVEEINSEIRRLDEEMIKYFENIDPDLLEEFERQQQAKRNPKPNVSNVAKNLKGNRAERRKQARMLIKENKVQIKADEDELVWESIDPVRIFSENVTGVAVVVSNFAEDSHFMRLSTEEEKVVVAPFLARLASLTETFKKNMESAYELLKDKKGNVRKGRVSLKDIGKFYEITTKVDNYIREFSTEIHSVMGEYTDKLKPIEDRINAILKEELEAKGGNTEQSDEQIEELRKKIEAESDRLKAERQENNEGV